MLEPLRTVRAVFFDAVGTLFHPEPSVSVAYHNTGQRFGSLRDRDTIRAGFATAFARQEAFDRTQNYRTSEEREVQRWRNIVAEVLPDMNDAEAGFQELYRHFGLSSAWRVEADAAAVVARLLDRGFRLGVASNFDHRLVDVVAGFSELARVRPLIVSSQVGHRKPALDFFQAVCASVDLRPEEILFVGDDFENDFLGAQAAGLKALLLDPVERWAVPAGARLRRLSELLEKIDTREDIS
jgi:putative hydrolase of the HAD superfamily